MASVINATTTGSGGLITTGDASNELVIQTGDTAAVSIDGSQNVTVDNDLSVSGDVAVTGTLTVQGSAPASTGKAIAMAIVFGG